MMAVWKACVWVQLLVFATYAAPAEDAAVAASPDAADSGCKLPEYPHNRYTLVNCTGAACSRQQGHRSPIQNMVNFTCEEGYHMKLEDHINFLLINCKKDGDWWRPVPECVKKEAAVQISSGCLLPSYPPKVKGYKLWMCLRETCVMIPGRSLPHKSNLFITCEEGFASAAEQDTPVCNNGEWSRPIPQCYKTCPPLTTGDKIEALCGENEDPCGTPQALNTTAAFVCPESYTPSSKDPMTCGADGTWLGKIPVCEKIPDWKNSTVSERHGDSEEDSRGMPASDPGCGVAQPDNSVDVDPAKKTARAEAEAGNFPWHAAIYRKVKGEWTNVCSGVLVNSNHILTAADCVVKKRGCSSCHPPVRQMKPSELMVAVGKTLRHWDPQEQHEVRRAVNSIVVKNSFYNLYVKQKDYANLAVLRLASPVVFNKFILPVCTDHANAKDTSAVTSGYMSGWDRGAECTTGSKCDDSSKDNLLHDTEVVSNNQQCHSMLMKANYSYVIESSPYHICTSNSKDVPEHIVDPGAGLTYKVKDKHHLLGIFLRQVKDDSTGFGLFTKVHSFENLISKEIGKSSNAAVDKEINRR